MPRHPNEHTTRLSTIYVKPEWARALDRIAADDGKTLNAVIREALAAYFKRRGVKP